MLANAAFVFACGLFLAAVSSVFALIGADLSVPLIAITFVWGAFLGGVAIGRHGSAAAVWRRLRRPPA